MLDSYGRNIHYLRVSVTDRCNLRCTYCMPAEGVPFILHERILRYEQIGSICQTAAKMGFDKIRLTGGEPLVRKGIVELVSIIRKIQGIETLSMTTNGTLLAPLAAELAARGLSSVNISLDTLDPAQYSLLTRGGKVQDAIAGIQAARVAGLPVKLNVVVSTTDSASNGDLPAIEAFARKEGCTVQTIRYYRLDEPKYDDSSYMRPPPCGDCNRIRLLSTGEFKPCLHSDLSVPVDFSNIEQSIRDCVNLKPSCGQSAAQHLVSAIGG